MESPCWFIFIMKTKKLKWIWVSENRRSADTKHSLIISCGHAFAVRRLFPWFLCDNKSFRDFCETSNIHYLWMKFVVICGNLFLNKRKPLATSKVYPLTFRKTNPPLWYLSFWQDFLSSLMPVCLPVFPSKINFLPPNCNFSLKIFVGYKKLLIFAPKFTPLVRNFGLSMRGQEH